MKKLLLGLVLFFGFFSPLKAEEVLWKTKDENGNQKTVLYFFWSTGCPHCHKARPFIDQLEKDLSFISLKSLPVDFPNNRNEFIKIAKEIKTEPSAVPAFAFCGQMIFGYRSDKESGEPLKNALIACHQSLWNLAPKPEEIKTEPEAEIKVEPKHVPEIDLSPRLNLPFLGEVKTSALSLPLITVALAGLDAFNPCAFFVLLFLLSLMVNAKSRAKMFLVGGTFVLFSGLIYFAFMAAWLNLFKLLGDTRGITLVAATLALIAGTLNLKDFFFMGSGPSLSLKDEQKTSLFKRMNRLVGEQNLGMVLIGTIVLAVIVNSYELLCTAGFPMVFTRILTLRNISGTEHYLYLALYNVIYVLPLFVIVSVFALTLGKRKLSENEGRFLKLLSGVMMVLLGATLLLNPILLDSIAASVGLLLFAIIISFGLMLKFGKAR